MAGPIGARQQACTMAMISLSFVVLGWMLPVSQVSQLCYTE